jgi:hypothetical protein
VVKKTVLLTSAGVYQLLRFTVLAALIMASRDAVSSPTTGGAVLALAASAVLPAVLILQLALTGSRVLLAPLRVGLFLQALGSVLFLIRSVPAQLAAVDPMVPVLLTTVLLPLFDAGALLFLLLYGKRRDDDAGASTEHGRTAASIPDEPEVFVVELEE